MKQDRNIRFETCPAVRISNLKSRRAPGFTLAEAIVTLAIAAVIMITAMGIYTGVKRAEAGINRRLESGFIASEILQRINEDIDRLALPGSDVAMSVKNKIDSGMYKSSQLTIESKIYDKDNKPVVFEKIVWQSYPDTEANGLIVYRSHSGYTLEDKMLDEEKEKYERERYIPLSSGVTLFSITTGAESNDANLAWTSQNFPPSLKASISYAQPQQDITGNIVVPPEEIKTRTIVVNRFKEIPYQFVYKTFGDVNEANEVVDANQAADANKIPDANDYNMPPGLNTVEEPGATGRIPEMPGRTNERRRE